MSMHQPSILTRRRFPRIEVSLAIEVKAECGLLFDTVTRNISQTGLLIVTDRGTFKQLTMNQRLADKSQPAEVDIKLSLSREGDASIVIQAHCKLLQYRRISSDCYHIGLEYSELSESEYDELTGYIQGVTAYREGGQLCQMRAVSSA